MSVSFRLGIPAIIVALLMVREGIIEVTFHKDKAIALLQEYGLTAPTINKAAQIPWLDREPK